VVNRGLFYLGAHEPQWLHRTDVPLFISHKRLIRYMKDLPIAKTRWALDSGAFSELAKYGEWLTTEAEYVHAVLTYQDEMGELDCVHLEDEPIVGVGSVCRRQATGEATAIFASLRPLRLHGFGVKLSGLTRFGHFLTSCDSLAWSYEAWKQDARLPGHQTHKHCGNCLDYALHWREGVIRRMEESDGHRTSRSP